MKMQPAVIVKKLFMEGTMVTVNHEIDFEKAQEIALDYNIIAEPEEKVDVIEELLKEDEEDEKDMVPRPPVVCVMGHVDHGKTSLLDCIRNTHVTDREAGGITQHIGAYTVSINKQKITFLDTPGHEAFTAMRMRGANATDIAILVVAADDGVMPQTVEAINHAKAAGVEIIVAINKIDKPGANVERVKQELSEYELIPEDWGGSTVFVPVSAKNNEGIDDLLEMILLTSEVLELKANPNRKARGLVIEAELDKGKGPVATILVQKGTLHVGDYIAAGACSGKVRAMMDDKGRRVKEAGPSTPVEILGLSDVPNAGEILVQTDNDKEAKNFAATFVAENKKNLLEETKAKMSLDDLFNQIQEGNLKELALVVKADVQGSVEAVKQSLVKLSNEEVAVRVIHGGVGAINESDVMLATASSAIIIGFNVRPDANAKSMAEQNGVDIRLYRVIYQAIEDVEAAMKGMLEPVYEEKVIGHAEVRQLFKASGVGTIAGSYVLDGTFQRGCKVRISREGNQIFEGNLASLKRFKDDVKEVRSGYECGLVFEGFNDLQEFDQVEAYIMVEVPR
jgi:translation initiation factor IF-2